jgi:uncharacterized membrane protein
MEIQTPAVVFPAISMLLVAYTSRFMVISQRIRTLHEKYNTTSTEQVLMQLANFRQRLTLIKWMQCMGVLAFIMVTLTILMILLGFLSKYVQIAFGVSLTFLVASLGLALNEVMISTRAIEIELQNIEDDLKKVDDRM